MPTAFLLALTLSLSLSLAPPAHADPARVLREDPPLPGEPMDGWEALLPPPDRPPDEVLDADEAVALALTRSPELRAAALEVDRARAGRRVAGAWPNPVWEVELEREPDGAEALSLAVELDVTDWLLAPVRAGAAAPDIDAARLRAAEAAVRLGVQVRSAFYDHQAALAAWSAALRSVDALAASRDTARAMAAAGNAPARDVALREVAYEEARLRAAELELDVVATRERLARAMGELPGTVTPTLAAAPEDLVTPADIESAAVAASLSLQALDADLRAARRRTTAARVAGLAPDVDLFVRAEDPPLPDVGAGVVTVGAAVSLPLFASGAGDAARASAEADILRARREAEVRDVRSAAREAHVRLVSAHRRALHVQDVLVPGRERALHETLLQYNAMQVGIDPLLDAWRAHVDAGIALADALRDLWTARAALDALLAGARVDPAPAATPPSALGATAEGGH